MSPKDPINNDGIFVVLPIKRDFLAFKHKKQPVHFMNEPLFNYEIPSPGFSLIDYTKKCINFLKQNSQFKTIVYSQDISSLIAGAICDELGLVGPSLESMFLCFHKYYSRCAYDSNLWFKGINLNDDYVQLENRLFPCYLKPALLYGTLLQNKINNNSQLEQTLSLLKSKLPSWENDQINFFDLYLNKAKYKNLGNYKVIIEEFIEGATQHCIQGWSDTNGTPHSWAISDSIYSGEPKVLDYYLTPSTLNIEKQKLILDSAKEVAINHQIKNSLWNVELWLRGDKIIITEINGRAASVWENIYKNVFNLSIYEAMLSVAQGKSPANPPQEISSNTTQLYGAQFHVVSHKNGEAANFFNFKLANEISANTNLKMFFKPKDTLFKTQTSGNVLASFELYGSNIEKLDKEANNIREQLLL